MESHRPRVEVNGMEKVKNYYPLFALILIFILGIWFSYSYFPTETKANALIAFITFLVGILVVYLYIKQKEDTKKDAAKIILQEIRRAEDIINDYKEHGQYKFTKKIIATNSWAKNIHYFVGDLDPDELDKISNLYSTGEYLDSIITKVSDTKFETGIKVFEENIERISNLVSKGTITANVPDISGGQLQSGQQPLNTKQINTKQIIKLPITIPAPWKNLLDDITFKYEPIYHSTITDKLKKIAKVNL